MKKLFCRLSLTLFLIPCISFAQPAYTMQMVEHGDLNCDGALNILDAVMEINRIVNQAWDDADDDGNIDVFDDDHCYDHYVEGMASNPNDLWIAWNEGAASVPELMNCFQSGFCYSAIEMMGYGSGEAVTGHATMVECYGSSVQSTWEWDRGYELIWLFSSSLIANYTQALCTE